MATVSVQTQDCQSWDLQKQTYHLKTRKSYPFIGMCTSYLFNVLTEPSGLKIGLPLCSRQIYIYIEIRTSLSG